MTMIVTGGIFLGICGARMANKRFKLQLDNTMAKEVTVYAI